MLSEILSFCSIYLKVLRRSIRRVMTVKKYKIFSQIFSLLSCMISTSIFLISVWRIHLEKETKLSLIEAANQEVLRNLDKNSWKRVLQESKKVQQQVKLKIAWPTKLYILSDSFLREEKWVLVKFLLMKN